ncbi:MAG: hypothetical protein KBC83_04140 [Candidatus Moranbacteria bacterium]|jgi:predicted PolB exonuclease-like 3'-5' exonuclease|nr:hypothetical protein [Candidatus Moranbacteria bacterium]MBP9801825.1 hypothetical protein [Candidatus Moranbacteria bacterium]
MNKKKFTLATLAVIVTSGVVILGVGRASADTNTQSTLVQMIAQKFGLNQSDVQSVFSQHHQERQGQMTEQLKTKLDQEVAAGKMTVEQETLLLNKYKELSDKRASQMENFKNLTPAEKQAAREKEKQDLVDWAKQNNVDIQYLHGGSRQMGMGHGFGSRKNQSAE